MSTATLRPNGTVSNTGALTGGASAHEVLSDDSDASRVTLEVAEACEVALANYSEVAGSVVRSVQLRIRSAASGASSASGTAAAKIDGDTHKAGFGVSVFEGPVTLTVLVVNESFDDGDVDAATAQIEHTGSFGNIELYELYFDVIYVEQPDLTVDAPTGTVRDTNEPEVRWTPDLDSDGGSQTHFEAKVFDDATYGDGGFDPDTSTPAVESGETASAAAAWQVDEPLPDDTYRAYVRIAQTVNGVQHWSAWEFSGFVVDVLIPADPTLLLTPQSDDGRIQIDLDDNAGDATTDAFQVQWSHDRGSTWTPVRTSEGEGIVLGDDETVWDFEAPNGETVTYRARALHDYSGLWAASGWVQDSDSWSSGDRWLKHPTNPDLNMKVEIDSYASHSRAARRQVFQPLGRTDPVVVSDTRWPKTGEVVLWMEDDDERDALEALLDTLAPLLLQAADGDERPDRWVVFGDVAEESAVDKLAVSDTRNRLTWTEVARP